MVYLRGAELANLLEVVMAVQKAPLLVLQLVYLKVLLSADSTASLRAHQ
jgi:hypothetical protein